MKNNALRQILKNAFLNVKTLESLNKQDNLIEETIQKIHANEPLLTEKEISQKYPFLTLIKLRNMRQRKNGPKYVKFGEHRSSRVYYRISDVNAWIEENYQREMSL